MLKFNTFRSQRYLRSRFIEGTFFLASDATDMELELIDKNRTLIKTTLGDIAVEDSWKVEKFKVLTTVTSIDTFSNTLFLDTTILDLVKGSENVFVNGTLGGVVTSVDLGATSINVTNIGSFSVNDEIEIETKDSLLIRTGEIWYEGLPFIMQSSQDALTSGSNRAMGLAFPVGGGVANITAQDDPSGRGKILSFNDGGTTASGIYRITISAREEVVTNLDDPFLKNANIPESTAQKLRLTYRINVVPEASIDSTPVPYTNTSTDGNLVNTIIVTPTPGGEGSEVSRTTITGSEAIDGRNLEIIFKNTTGGNKLPSGAAEQTEFSNGIFTDSVGNKYHINLITNDIVANQVIIRLDKAFSQPDPIIIDSQPFTLTKRDVYVTDDVNGTPQGQLFYPLATVNLQSGGLFSHNSKIIDLRQKVITKEDFEEITNTKFDLKLAEGGVISYEVLDTDILDWDADFSLLNPHGPIQTIAANQVALIDNASVAYFMDVTTGGPIEQGNKSITVSNFGTVVTTTGSPDLSDIKIGNMFRVGSETRSITAIDDVSKTLTLSSATTVSGTATIYLDTYASGLAPIDSDLFVLATRKGTSIYFSSVQVGSGESTTLGSGIPQDFIDYVGAPDENTPNPDYTGQGGPYIIVNGVSLTTGITDLDNEINNINDLLSTPVYDERQLFPAGVPISTDLTIPVNSRDGAIQQTYGTGDGELEVYFNGRTTFQGEDWIGISTTQIRTTYALPLDTEIHYRIDALGGNAGGGGGGGDEWGDPVDANIVPNATNTYDLGSAVSKFRNGYFAGKLTVDGVIDPTGLELVPQASNPLDVGQRGLWISTTEELVHQKNGSSDNLTQKISDLETGVATKALVKAMSNITGSLIPAGTPVYSPTAGNIAPANGNSITTAKVIGITVENIPTSDSGLVAYAGLIENVTGFTHNDDVFLDQVDGQLTDTEPSTPTFPVGFVVMRIGVIEGTNLFLQISREGIL